MGDFGLVICSMEETRKEIRPECLRRLLETLNRWNKARKMEIEVHQIKLYDNLQAQIIKLPFTLDECSRMTKRTVQKINGVLGKLSSECGLQTCVIPKKLQDINILARNDSYGYDGCILFKSLISNILDVLYVKRGIELSEVETTILSGTNMAELFSLLKLLAPWMKYITIVAPDKSAVEQEAENLYEETGLSLRVTEEYKSGLKNAQLIINFSSLKEEIKFRLQSKAIIINLGSDCISKKVGESSLINGVEVKFPLKLFKLMDREIFRFFTCTQLAEIILLHRLDIEPDTDSPFDFIASSELSREFDREGYRITGFVGRRNVFRISDFKNY